MMKWIAIILSIFQSNAFAGVSKSAVYTGTVWSFDGSNVILKSDEKHYWKIVQAALPKGKRLMVNEKITIKVANRYVQPYRPR